MSTSDCSPASLSGLTDASLGGAGDLGEADALPGTADGLPGERPLGAG